MNKKPQYIITWGNTAMTDAGYCICGSASTETEAIRKIKECDMRPGSAKAHRLFIVKEVKIGKR